MNRNDRLHDAWIRRAHDLVRIENGLTAHIRSALQAAITSLIAELRDANIQPAQWDHRAVSLLIYQRIFIAAQRAAQHVAGELDQLAPRWFAVQARTLFAKLGPTRIRRLAPTFQRTLARRIADRLTEEEFTISATLNPADILDDFFKLIGDHEMAGFSRSVVADYSARFERFGDRMATRIVNTVGLTIEEQRDLLDALAELEATLQAVVRDLEAVTGDAVQQLAFDSENMLLDYVGTEVGRVLRVAVLDLRTCLICARSHAVIYRVDAPRPPLPTHPRCRCTYVPIIDGEDPPEQTTYEEWLRRQHWTRQRKTLGATRYRLYRAGVPISRFVNDRGRILRVSELPDPGKVPNAWRQSRQRRRKRG